MGGRIRFLRKEKQLTQQELADRLFVGNKSKISRVENNAESLTPCQLEILAGILGTTTDYLLKGEETAGTDPWLNEAVIILRNFRTGTGREAVLEILRRAVVLEQVTP